MGEATKIQWTDHTFNPWWGCARVSPGCEHCYAESFAKRVGEIKVPCVLRCGVWAVTRSADKRLPWVLSHVPSGMQLTTYATRRHALRACRAAGEAYGAWGHDAGFGEGPDVPAELTALVGARAIVRAG
jgi:hypothetical protein